MGASRSTLPASTSCSTAVAVIGLVTDASRKTVSLVTGTEFSRSARPYAADHRTRRSVTTAADSPGMPSCVIAARMRASMASIFAGGSPGDGAAAGEGDGDCASAAPSASAHTAAVSVASLQPVLVLQLLRKVLLGDEADPAPGQRLELELEAALHHLLDLALPAGLLEPRV